jgi:hypothetical protein
LEEIKKLQDEVNDLLQVDEFMKWKQRTKEHWLKHGDRNSKYFHACVNQRRRSNRISSVNTMDGSLCTTEEGIIQAFQEFFQNLFSSSSPVCVVECMVVVDKKKKKYQKR